MAVAKAYDEIIDFIAGGSSPADVLVFQPSEESRQRVEDLIRKEKTLGLSPSETVELDRYMQLEHIMRLAKARAIPGAS